MNDRKINDDELDRLLADHFSAELQSHVGSAAERFSRAITPANVPPPRGLRLWWAVPAVAAAATLALVLGPQLRSVAPEPADSPMAALPPAVTPNAAQSVGYEPTDVEGSVYWETHDEGQVWLDDQTPVRQFRTQQFQTLRWTDPRDSSRIEITVPREEVVLVSSPRI